MTMRAVEGLIVGGVGDPLTIWGEETGFTITHRAEGAEELVEVKCNHCPLQLGIDVWSTAYWFKLAFHQMNCRPVKPVSKES